MMRALFNRCRDYVNRTLGLTPPKSKLQDVASLFLEAMERVPPRPHLDNLRVVVRECEDPSSVDIEFTNLGSHSLRQVEVKVAHELLYPSVASWDQWNRGARVTDVVTDFFQPITVASLGAGETAILRRALFPTVLPESKLVNITAIVDNEAESLARDFYVKVAVSSGIAPKEYAQR
jgi:hypothetical protein